MASSEQDVFDEALALDDPNERAVYLARACLGDESLRRRVETLLAAYLTGEFLESPAEGVGVLERAWREGSLAGTTVGPYAVLELVGEGGMGDVYLARRAGGDRHTLALKVIKPGMDSRQVIARFELERAALAKMDHPHIAQFIEAGVTEQGRAYIAMELVRGLPITLFCDRQRLHLAQRAKLMVDLCLAVHYAHSKGLIHRDLKPSNVLVTEVDGEPTVKVIDFGVAKALNHELSDCTVFTRASQLIGTPIYMSPEQVRWGPNVDVRSDVYSLGVLLYELLCGSPPLEQEAFDRFGFQEFARIIQDDDPPTPSNRLASLGVEAQAALAADRGVSAKQLRLQIRGDLDWIVVKALSKDPALRYGNPGEFAEDLNRYLTHRVVHARAPRPWVRARKWARRHSSSLWGLLVTATTFGAVWGGYQVTQAYRGNRLTARVGKEAATHQRYCNDVQMAWLRVLAGDRQGALRLLDNYATGAWGSEEAGFEWRLVHGFADRKPLRTFQGPHRGVLSADVSPDERWLACGGRSGELIVRDARTGDQVYGARSKLGEITTASFSPNGQWLAWSGQDRTIHICRTGVWLEVKQLQKNTMTICAVAWSPDGKWLAAATRDGDVHIWDAVGWQHHRTLSGHVDAVRCVAWSPDGRYLASSNGTAGVILWDTTSWRQALIEGSQTATLAVAFSPDSRRLAFGGYGRVLSVALVDAPSTVIRIAAAEQIWSLEYLSDHRILAGLGDGKVQLFRVINKRPPRLNQLDSEWVVSFGTRGTHRVLIAMRGGEAFLLAREEDRELELIRAADLLGFEAKPLGAIALGSAGGFLLTHETTTGATVVRNVNDPRAASLRVTPLPGCPPAYSEATGMYAVAGNDNAVYLFSSDDWQLLKRVEISREPVEMSFSKDGGFLAGSCRGRVWIIDVANNQLRELAHVHKFEVSAQFSPIDDLLVIGDVAMQQLTLLKGPQFEQLATMSTTSPIHAVKFHPSGDKLAVAEESGVSLWEIPSLEPLGIYRGHTRPARSIAFSRDGRTAASIASNGIHLWDVKTGAGFLSYNTWPTASHWLEFVDDATLLTGDRGTPTYRCFSAENGGDTRFSAPRQ